jgi:hypothetical protein
MVVAHEVDAPAAGSPADIAAAAVTVVFGRFGSSR